MFSYYLNNSILVASMFIPLHMDIWSTCGRLLTCNVQKITDGKIKHVLVGQSDVNK